MNTRPAEGFEEVGLNSSDLALAGRIREAIKYWNGAGSIQAGLRLSIRDTLVASNLAVCRQCIAGHYDLGIFLKRSNHDKMSLYTFYIECNRTPKCQYSQQIQHNVWYSEFIAECRKQDANFNMCTC